jgi:hypothetical protein
MQLNFSIANLTTLFDQVVYAHHLSIIHLPFLSKQTIKCIRFILDTLQATIVPMFPVNFLRRKLYCPPININQWSDNSLIHLRLYILETARDLN